MYCPVEVAAEKFSNLPAVISEDQAWTYKQLNDLIHTAQVENRPFIAKHDLDTIVILFALLRKYTIAFPLSHRLLPLQIQEAAAALLPPSTIALFTSGSSGKPKIACIAPDHFLYSALGSNTAIPLTPGDRWHLVLPPFHVGGIAILYRCFLAGAAVTFSPSQATHLSLVPTQLHRLQKQQQPLNSYKCIVVGGAPIPPHIEQSPSLFTSYGMTEMSSTITLNGLPLPHREVCLAADGEILVKGKVLFKGYLNEGELHLPLNADGYFHTKDLGKWIDGKLHILGRKDSLFISGGENIQPEEIETALLAIPGLLDAVVVPIPSEEFGARPAAFIRGHITLEQLRSSLSATLPKFKIPDFFFPLPETSFKPNRTHLTKVAASFLNSQRITL